MLLCANVSIYVIQNTLEDILIVCKKNQLYNNPFKLNKLQTVRKVGCYKIFWSVIVFQCAFLMYSSDRTLYTVYLVSQQIIE